MKEKEIKYKVLQVEENLHKQLKLQAVKEGKKIKDFVQDALEAALQKPAKA